jgi:hypothetical protein
VKRLRIYHRPPEREARRRRPGDEASGKAASAAPESAETQPASAEKTPS